MHYSYSQMIAHYSVNFYPIQNHSKVYLYNYWIVSVKNFKAITLMVVLVGMARNWKRFFSNICVDFYELQLLE